MPAYLIADIQITEPVGYEEYRRGVAPTIAKYGGRFIARGGSTQVLEGQWNPNRVVVLEFPSIERLKEWYDSPEYRPLRDLRQRTSEANMVLVDGI